MHTWTHSVTRNGNLRKQFNQWSVPAEICNDLHLEDGDKCYIDVLVKNFRHSGYFTLTSGKEFRFSNDIAEKLSDIAKKSQNATITFTITLPFETIERRFLTKVEEAIKLTPKERKQKLAEAPKLPKRTEVTISVFERNPYVVEAVLRRAAGFCEKCKQKAPFVRATDGTDYLEVHHIKRLVDGGEDAVNNAIALCPNCHREIHYGKLR